MNTLRLLTLVAALAVSLPAAAHEKNAINPRQLAHCMVARMKASRSESYREALKSCQQQQPDPPRREADTATASNAADRAAPPNR